MDVFFVLSGFLITLLLLREWDRSGGVSLKGFYWRRGLRILPAYFAYLLFVFALARCRLVTPTPWDWVGALTYTTNFLPSRLWELGHLWSLSVEEHFYLLWPATLVCLGPRRAGILLLGVLVIACPLRLALWKWTALDVGYVTPARYEAIGYGCLLAFAVRQRVTWQFAARIAPCAGLGAVICVGLLATSQLALPAMWWGYRDVVAPTVAAIVITTGVFFCLVSARGSVGWFLELRPLVFVGTLSYSLYLWQQPFMNHEVGRWWTAWPWGMGLAVVAALLCHYLIERPLLRLKDKVKN